MHIQLVKHLSTYEILPMHQSGFRQGHSCATALLKVSDDILKAYDSGQLSALVLLDFTKAFDTISHRLLISILHFIGLGNNATYLISDYLEGRTQATKIDNNLSSESLLIMGVPQGSILGPLLFSIYTSNFCNKLEYCVSHMYADDTQLYLSFNKNQIEESKEKINLDLGVINTVSKEHCLFLNPKKSKLLLFGNKSVVSSLSESFQVEVDNTIIPFVNSADNLGVTFDNTFRFKNQISKYVQRSYCALKLIYPHKNYLSENIKTMLCELLVLSNFNYCAPLYYPCLDMASKYRVQKVQNSCIRYIFGIRRRDHVTHKLKDINWLTMNNRLKLATLCLYHQIVLSKQPVYLYNKIRFRTDVHNINIRKKNL